MASDPLVIVRRVLPALQFVVHLGVEMEHYGEWSSSNNEWVLQTQMCNPFWLRDVALSRGPLIVRRWVLSTLLYVAHLGLEMEHNGQWSSNSKWVSVANSPKCSPFGLRDGALWQGSSGNSEASVANSTICSPFGPRDGPLRQVVLW